ncbi:MAG: hypothetical protein J0I98_11515 [Mesorhizobium sp.]|nr:hypothetical protein [Mesorhizobium sp.]MBN9243412.1 hypothetical protein [Mesorhizobium sp.]
MDHLETGRAALDGADPKARARLIAARFEAVLAEEITAAQAAMVQAIRDKTVMDACHRLGDAVDRWEAACGTAEEIPARRALEKAARNLRNKMDGSKRYARR